MSGAVLTVTLLAGLATLGASVFVVRGETKETAARKADELFHVSKQPYDFTLNKAGVERLQALQGRLLLTAVADPRFEVEMVRLLTPAALAELSRSKDEVPAILKAVASENKQRDLVARLADVLKDPDTRAQVSGQVAAWVLMLEDEASQRELILALSAGQCEFAVKGAMELCADPAFRFRGESRDLVTRLLVVRRDREHVRRFVVAAETFLRSHIHHAALALVLPHLGDKSPTFLANLDVVKKREFDEEDIHAIADGVRDSSSLKIHDFMRSTVMPQFATRQYKPVATLTWTDPGRTQGTLAFTAVGHSARVLESEDKKTVVEDKVANAVLTVSAAPAAGVHLGRPTAHNTFAVALQAAPSVAALRAKATITRAFDFEDVRELAVSER